ncbi:FAD-dependent oxidoreductase [Jannaschia seohaensis]|uniref:FAD-dependent oxidoreductase n=1 Tax=Jannaschia seohaensis TaxID=475081 RepID=UPI000D6D1D97|nr:FAD-dependent oxidoreductase [Jannaschia seohaensis]
MAIVGAGLSGLALAVALRAEGRDVRVLEARDRPGGRVLSQHGYDLGPAWIWPHNHRLLTLARRLGLRTFPQYSAGRLVFEDGRALLAQFLDGAVSKLDGRF